METLRKVTEAASKALNSSHSVRRAAGPSLADHAPPKPPASTSMHSSHANHESCSRPDGKRDEGGSTDGLRVHAISVLRSAAGVTTDLAPKLFDSQGA